MSKNIHLAIDANEANIKNRVGSNVYAFEIIKAMYHIAQRTSHNTHQKIKITILLSTPPINDLPPENDNWHYQVIGPKPFWTQFALPIHLYLNKKKYDVYFTPGHYAARISSVPYVSSVMDTAYLDYPDQFRKNDLLQLRDWTKYSVENASKVIAISQSTKDDVINHYGKKDEDVVIAYPSLTENNKNISKSVTKRFFKKHNIGDNYILYLGTLQPRKNLLRLIAGFEGLVRKVESEKVTKQQRSKVSKKQSKTDDDLQLVIAGKIGWLADPILDRIANSPFSNQIILTDFVSEAEKRVLYEHAQASTLVGLYEGFGMPPLESMSYGVIPVVSNTTSLPEVVGDGGILVNPENAKDITEGFYQAINLKAKEKAKYRRNMRKQLKKFSWEKSADTILNTLIELASST